MANAFVSTKPTISFKDIAVLNSASNNASTVELKKLSAKDKAKLEKAYGGEITNDYELQLAKAAASASGVDKVVEAGANGNVGELASFLGDNVDEAEEFVTDPPALQTDVGTLMELGASIVAGNNQAALKADARAVAAPLPMQKVQVNGTEVLVTVEQAAALQRAERDRQLAARCDALCVTYYDPKVCQGCPYNKNTIASSMSIDKMYATMTNNAQLATALLIPDVLGPMLAKLLGCLQQLSNTRMMMIGQAVRFMAEAGNLDAFDVLVMAAGPANVPDLQGSFAILCQTSGADALTLNALSLKYSITAATALLDGVARGLGLGDCYDLGKINALAEGNPNAACDLIGRKNLTMGKAVKQLTGAKASGTMSKLIDLF